MSVKTAQLFYVVHLPPDLVCTKEGISDQISDGMVSFNPNTSSAPCPFCPREILRVPPSRLSDEQKRVLRGPPARHATLKTRALTRDLTRPVYAPMSAQTT
eukprot:6595394-Pyramimonas_sp.AAC.1